MKIAIVSEHASPLAPLGEGDAGGQHIHVAALSAALARNGHEVRVYTRRDDPALDETVATADGVLVEHVPVGPAGPVAVDDLLPYMGDFGRWMAARWAEGPFHPDVVHAHFWLSGLAALTATAENRIPVVVTYHTLGSVQRRHEKEHDPSPETRVGLERTLGTLANRVIAQSEDEVTELGRIGIRRADTVVVPAGVDVDHFGPAGSTVDRAPDGRQRIISAGPLVERKGFADLITALRRVPGAELLIVGGPPPHQLDRQPEAVRLRELAERHGVADRVHLVGAVPHTDLPAWLRSADVVAATPRYGSFGRTPLEAMACGVPVVAYAVGGIAESVIDGVTGTLVPPHDTTALAAALRGLLGDDVRRMSYASAAVDRVRSRYTWERTVAEIERVYAAVTGAPADTEEPLDEDALSEADAAPAR